MSSSGPSEIKDCYIAYFDILGYKEFFKNQSDKVPELLKTIHEAIQRTKNHLASTNRSWILNEMANIEIHSKIFSDNIFLCMEVSDSDCEQIRLLAFIQIVADIQRGFVNEYGLFIRGCILKGKVSINEDYVFGQGLIDAVKMEVEALYPRIVIDEALCVLLRHITLPLEETIQMIYNYEVDRLIMKWPDEKYTLCYLSRSDITARLGDEFKEKALHIIHSISESDYQLIQQPYIDFDNLLCVHKMRVEEQLRKHGNYTDIAVGDIAKAELREKVLRKYIWVMAFHNIICDYYQKSDAKIYTECNCEPRFLKMTIKVL